MKGQFYELVRAAAEKHGGLYNAHLHLDRSATLDQRYLEHVRLDRQDDKIK